MTNTWITHAWIIGADGLLYVTKKFMQMFKLNGHRDPAD